MGRWEVPRFIQEWGGGGTQAESNISYFCF